MEENLNKKYYGCIYITRNMINGKGYTGQSTRINDVLGGRYKGSGTVIGAAFNKYGFKNFKSEILEFIENDINLVSMEERLQLQDRLDDRETYWIIENETYNPLGYNIAEGGNRGGFLLKYASEENKKKWGEKISTAHRGNTYCLGYKHNDEFKKKQSENNKGIKNPMYGRVGELSPNFNNKFTKDKIWVTNGVEEYLLDKNDIIPENWGVGRKEFSEEHKNNISKNAYNNQGENNPFYGKNHSEESKVKMRKPRSNTENMKGGLLKGKDHPMYGKNQSNETKEKISQSHLNRPLLICPYCNLRSRGGANMKRYHFDNCKLKI